MEVKRIITRLCTIIPLILTLVSCEKSSEIPTADKPVIQSYLVPGQDILVKVNMQKGLLDTAEFGHPISGLQVSIDNGSKSIILTETKKGQYTSSDKSFVSTGKTYSLSFKYLDIPITAKTSTPRKPIKLSITDTLINVPEFVFGSTSSTFIPVRITWENPDKVNHMIIFKNDSQHPSSFSSGFGFNRSYEDIEETVALASFYEIQQMTFRYTGYYTVYLYALNQEYINVNASSSGSSLNLTNPVTNIENGLGIFTSMNVDSLRIFVREK